MARLFNRNRAHPGEDSGLGRNHKMAGARGRSGQKPRFLHAGDEVMSEKWQQG
jgi:hypothetical protein